MAQKGTPNHATHRHTDLMIEKPQFKLMVVTVTCLGGGWVVELGWVEGQLGKQHAHPSKQTTKRSGCSDKRTAGGGIRPLVRKVVCVLLLSAFGGDTGEACA